jgi:hypothetical protein
MIENYLKLNNGIIKQNNIIDEKQIYNVNYIKDRYDTYSQKSMYMSYLRLGFLMGSCDNQIKNILDVGYGNGDFLKAASNSIPNCYGFEVNSYEIPEKCLTVNDIYEKEYDVVCFFDVLEHFDNIYEIKNLKTKYIYISVPECHYFSDEWFLNWKHRRPDEHLWHFNLNSLCEFMKEIGFKLVKFSNIEDSIRKPQDEHTNILTALFEKV